MGLATPFANQPRARLEAEARHRANPPGGPQRLRYRLELSPDRLAESAIFGLLHSVGQSKHQQIATDPGRRAVIEPDPFAAQFLKVERADAIELALDRIRTDSTHG